MIKRTILLQ